MLFFSTSTKLFVFNGLDDEKNYVKSMLKKNSDLKSLIKIGDDLRPVAERLLDALIDAKEYGSIINVNILLILYIN